MILNHIAIKIKLLALMCGVVEGVAYDLLCLERHAAKKQ